MMDVWRFTSRLILCAMDHARDTGEMCGPPFCASNELEGTVALSGTAATSLFVVENSLEIRSNLGFAFNDQKNQSAVPHNTQGSKYLKPSPLGYP